LESRLTDTETILSEDSVDQMLILAERLRAANGGELDDSAIQAVAEATGAPVEYVRVVVKRRVDQERKSFMATIRSQVRTLEPGVRRSVMSAFAAAMCALFTSLSVRIGGEFLGELLNIVALVWLTAGLYCTCVARDARGGTLAGGIFAGVFFAAFELFGVIFGLGDKIHPPNALFLIPSIIVGALFGLTLQRITEQYRGRLGLRDPLRERQELLQQLQDLQDRLKSGKAIKTFLSIDIVGSTRMKETADELSVEYTFNEYHKFVDLIVKKHSGQVHSTAGDGVTCAFDNPDNAFSAAKNITIGMIEVNTFRNRVGIPIIVRQAIHTGEVMSPDARDITSVNFAHVIDVAAHLQKAAPPGSVVVSDASVTFMKGGRAAIGVERVSASGMEGTVWVSKTLNAPSAGATPPLPPAP